MLSLLSMLIIPYQLNSGLFKKILFLERDNAVVAVSCVSCVITSLVNVVYYWLVLFGLGFIDLMQCF